MMFADKGIIPPKEWHHDPKLYDKYGETVATYLIKEKITPPEEWQN